MITVQELDFSNKLHIQRIMEPTMKLHPTQTMQT